MAYTNVSEFQTDFVRAQERARRFHGEGGQTTFLDWNIGWKLYGFTKKPALGMQTFGRHITGEKAKGLRDWKKANPDKAQLPSKFIGMSHGEKFFKNFGVVNDAEDGSILLMGGKKWNFTMNDTWIVGGVHGRVPFYPASILNKANLYHKDYVLTITGRELVGLCMFGYKLVQGYGSIGGALVCGNPSAADGARLVAYQDAISSLTSWRAAKRIYKDAGIKV